MKNPFKTLFKGTKFPESPRPGVKLVLPERMFVRRGMWVEYQGAIAILHEWFTDGSCEIHMVNPTDGTTYERKRVVLSDIVQAKAANIPACRLHGISSDDLARLGYA